MDWLLYGGIALALLLAAYFLLRTYRRPKAETTDDIYPMW